MTDRIPLSKKKKAKVLAELELCKTTQIEGWLPDCGVMPFLDRINANPGLVTLISRFAPASECRCGCVNSSYLQVAANRKAYDKLTRLVGEAEDKWDKTIYDGDAPIIQYFTSFVFGSEPDSVVEAPTTGLQIIDDIATYTSVDRVWFWCKSVPHMSSWEDMAIHYAFWEDLTAMLEKL